MSGLSRRRVTAIGVMGAAITAELLTVVFCSTAVADTGSNSTETAFGDFLGQPFSTGAASATGLFGDTGAAADPAAGIVPPIVTGYPLELLRDASDNLSAANHVLSGGAADVAGMTQQIDAQNIALDEIASLSTAESSLSSYDSGAFADLLNPWFTAVDQGWDQGTEALLAADQGVAAAVAAGSGTETAVLAVFGADFQLLGDMLNDIPIELAAGFANPNLFLSMAL